MKLSGRFDITNHAMGGAVLRNRKQWWSEHLMAHVDQEVGGSATCFASALLCGLGERLRNLGDRLLVSHGFEDANIVL